MATKKERIQAAQNKKSGMLIWGGLVAVILVVAGAVWFTTRPDANASGITPGTMTNLAEFGTEWGKGNPDAKLRIVEYGDFQCGACAYFHPIMQEVMEEFGDEVYFVWRHFPLVNAHQFATLAASASEAAGRQGKFWEMHDLIMRNQQTWSRGMATTMFLQFARELGLNDVQFQQDVRNPETLAKIERDYNSGVQLNLRAVPTFFFNGEMIRNPNDVNGFKALVREHLARLENQ
jgi:protein-disulfide isomerase